MNSGKIKGIDERKSRFALHAAALRYERGNEVMDLGMLIMYLTAINIYVIRIHKAGCVSG